MSGNSIEPELIDPSRRMLLTVGLMMSVLMQVLDTTIANVALPHMQSSLGATQDSISWVLTSYIVASAIVIPVAGWLADRIGRKRLLVLAVVGFTVASFLCAIAQSLPEMVLFRALQGVCGSFLVPLAQATMFDINPREKHAQAMALFGGGLMIGPILGPVLGGWLTDSFNWRWVFLVNLPIGVVAGLLLLSNLPKTDIQVRRFDLFGFALIAVALAALQLMLDRGQQQGWLESTEICIELGMALAASWVFVVHTLTADDPLFERRMFANRNFTTGLLFMGVTGVLMLAGLALLPTLLQRLYGYSVLQSGELTTPRGLGMLISIVVIGRFTRRLDLRVPVGVGMGLLAWSLYLMSRFALVQGSGPVIFSGVIQGIGLGLLFVTMQSLAFATLEPRLRTAASSLLNLSRNIGGSIGISIFTAELTRNVQAAHADIGANISTDIAPVALAPLIDQFGVTAQAALAMVDAEVNRQAAFLAYIDDFRLMMWVTIAAIPLVLILRPNKKGDEPEHLVMD